MKFINFAAVFLLALEYILCEELSYDSRMNPPCPDSKGESFHLSLKPNTDYYVCIDGDFKGYRVCFRGLYTDAFFNEDTGFCHFNLRQPYFVGKYFFFMLDLLVNEARIKKDVRMKRSITNTQTETTQVPEQTSTNVNSESSMIYKLTENSRSNIETEESCSTTELYKDLDKTSQKEDLEANFTANENESISFAVTKSNSSEKLKEFTRKLTIPLIEDIINDPKKMTKVASLFRKYFQAILPVATEIMEQSEEHPISGIRLQRKKLIETMKKIDDAFTDLLEALSEVLPIFLLKLSEHVELFLDTIEETSERFRINVFGLLFRFVMFLLKSSTTLHEVSADEFVEFPPMFDIRRDIEFISKIVTEVTQDRMFSEKINPATVMFQLMFY